MSQENLGVLQDIKVLYPHDTLIIDAQGTKENHIATLRLTCTSKEEFKDWLERYKHTSGDTMRASIRGSSVKKKHVIYKTWYSCRHNTNPKYHKVKKPRPQHTNCGTKCLVRIKSSVQGRRCRSKDPWRLKYPTEVIFYRKHNHSIDNAEDLKYEDVNDSVEAVVVDVSNDSVLISNPKSVHSLQENLQSHFSTTQDNVSTISNNSVTQDPETAGDTMTRQIQECEEKLRKIYNSMLQKLHTDPLTFVAAVNAYWKNYEQVKNQDLALCSAMHNFTRICKSPTDIPVQLKPKRRSHFKTSDQKFKRNRRPSKKTRTP